MHAWLATENFDQQAAEVDSIHYTQGESRQATTSMYKWESAGDEYKWKSAGDE